MKNHLVERSLPLIVDPESSNPIGDVETGVLSQLMKDEVPVRFAVTESRDAQWSCELGVCVGDSVRDSIFAFRERGPEDTSQFNVVMLVPTGIGAEIGGHAGDATPTAALLATVCDTLITHPNVLNASDIIQIPSNAIYVEGSVVSRLMMGTVGLNRVRANRLLVVIQDHFDESIRNAAYNAVNAARASYGLQVSRTVGVDSRFRMIARHTSSGTAAGQVEGLDHLWDTLDPHKEEFDAIAITSVIDVPAHYHRDYYEERGAMVNPWGGVEAILTHTISSRYGVPAAHSPMFESREIAELDVGVVDARMAAEVISATFLQSILRGLQHSPRLIETHLDRTSSLTAENIACLVIPDGCLGLPTLAALQQGIMVISVRENQNVMKNDLNDLPWRSGQYLRVDNYWEAAGVLAALNAGLEPASVRRPLREVQPQRLIPVDGIDWNMSEFPSMR